MERQTPTTTSYRRINSFEDHERRFLNGIRRDRRDKFVGLVVLMLLVGAAFNLVECLPLPACPPCEEVE